MPYSLTVAPVRRTWPTSAAERAREGDDVGQRLALQHALAEGEERLGRGVGVEHAVVVAEHQDRVRQRGEQQVVLDMPARAGASRRWSRAGLCVHAAASCACIVEGGEARRTVARVLAWCTAGGARPSRSRRAGRWRPDTSRYACGRCAGPAPAPSCVEHGLHVRDGDGALLGERGRARVAAARPARRRCARASTARHRRRARPSRRRHRRPQARRARCAGSTMSPLTTTGMRTASLTAAHEGPVGRALEELAARARMHGDELHARCLGATRQLGGVAARLIPPQPHLERDRDRDGADHRLDQRRRHGRDRASGPSPTACPSPRAPGSPC